MKWREKLLQAKQLLKSRFNTAGLRAVGWGALLLAVFSLTVWAGLFFGDADNQSASSAESSKSRQATTSPETVKKDSSSVFSEIQLQAAAVYVWDINNQEVLYQKNATDRRALASITKIMSAVTARDMLPPRTEITVTDEAMTVDGIKHLASGERWLLGDLLDLGLITSSNHAMAAVAGAAGSIISQQEEFDNGVDAFVRAMNRQAREIGLVNTEFLNPHGLDQNERTSGAYSTARDTAKLMEYVYLYHPEIMEVTQQSELVLESLTGQIRRIENTNTVLSELPGLRASKTGFTDLAGGNLAIIFDSGLNQPIVAVVLGSTVEGRFSDMLQLTDAALAAVSAPSERKHVNQVR